MPRQGAAARARVIEPGVLTRIHGALLIAAGLGGLGGCASMAERLGGLVGGPGASTLSSTSTPDHGAASPGLMLDIDAPAELKAVLGQHLDLARLAQLPDSEAPDASEITRLMAAAPAQARTLLQTEGYFAAEVAVQRQPGAPRHLQLKVRPGVRARVASVEVRAMGALAQQARAETGPGEMQATQPAVQLQAKALLQRLQTSGDLRRGDAFRNNAWADSKQQWLATLRAAGYASARLRSSAADVDVASASVALSVLLDSGPLHLAGPLQVQGLKQHDLQTVHNLASFATGQPLTESALLDFQDRLQKIGLFEAVSVTYLAQDPTDTGVQQGAQVTMPLGAPAASLAAVDRPAAMLVQVPVQVQLRELPLQQATVGLGWSTDSGPRASLDHTHRRLFGRAITAHNKLEWGRDAQRWSGDFFSHPGPGFTRWLLGAQLERLNGQNDVVVSQRLRLGRTQDTSTIERLVFVEALSSRQTSVGSSSLSNAGKSDAQALSANLHLVLRRLDNVLLPTQGASLSLQLGVGQARSAQAESGPFTRLLGRFTVYRPIDLLGAPWYAKARIEAGQIIKREAVAVPEALGFRAGGDESVRGYEHRSLAPQLGGSDLSGNVLITGSAELARPISAALPALWGAVFVDAGNAALRWQDLRPVFGYGLGVRWRSPIGPVRADLAWADALHRWRLHLSAGVSF